MLTKGKGLSPAELSPILSHPSQATLTGSDVLLVVHLHIVLWEASDFVLLEKGTVTSVEDVDLWIS